jgi:hypothetical protein
MPRPVSWLPRLNDIRRSVSNSVRSHYARKDIERLFQLQPRAAQTLMLAVNPAAKVGQSSLVAASDLAAFLDKIAEGANPTSLLASRPAGSPRRTLRELIQVDRTPTTLATMPGNIAIEPKRLTVTFESMEEIAQALLSLAEILHEETQFAEFEQRYVPPPPPSERTEDERRQIARMWEALETLERTFAAKMASE